MTVANDKLQMDDVKTEAYRLRLREKVDALKVYVQRVHEGFVKNEG